MRVLLALPGRGARGDAAAHEGMRRAIARAGHQLVDGKMTRSASPPDAARARMEFEHEFHLLSEADLLVADVSEESLTVGWMVAWFLAKGRLVVACAPANVRGGLTPLVLGNPNPWQRIVTYRSVEELEDALVSTLTR